MTSAPFLARLEASIERDPLYGCWLWVKLTDKDGYGTIYRTGGPRRAHLEAYRELVGSIPPGMVLDHVCRRRNCCRPAHLDPVKGSENDLRRSWRFRSRMTKCKNGHSLATCITTPEGGRLCRVCQGPERPRAQDEHPLFKMRRPFAGSTSAGTVEVVEHCRIYRSESPRHVIVIDNDHGDEGGSP